MRSLACWMFKGIIVLAAGLAMTGTSMAHQLKSGQQAPLFSLEDTSGKRHDLTDLKDQPMVVLYFFDVASRSSQEGLLHLDQMAKKYKPDDFTVWGVTRSEKSEVNTFIKTNRLTFTVLLDHGKITGLYHARMVLPTVCIVGPDLKLLDYFQGGGKNTQTLLVTLAERELQRRNVEVAKALSEQVTREDPQNARAQTVKGYAQLKEGDLKAAEKTFYTLSREKGEGEILGKEGLSQVYAQKGEPAKAVKIADEVESKSGQRAHTHVVKGDLLYSRNKTEEAEAEYRKAIGKTTGAASHKAVAYNQLGRIYALKGQYTQSRKMYDEAVTLDPYYVEATSNKGLTYERQGEWTKALEAYRRARTINRNDPFAAVLAANAQRMMLFEKDPDLKAEFKQRVETYVKQFKDGHQVTAAGNSNDPWTSGTTVLVMMEPVENGGLAKRDGFSRVLTLQVADHLKSSGRIDIIEPIMVERVCSVLGLTKKDLQDRHTQKRLIHAFGARLLVKGTLFHLSDSTLLKLKLEDMVDDRTFDIVERQFASAVTLKKDLHWLNRDLLTAVMTHYPLKGYAVEVIGNQVLINLGKHQGVVPGSIFDVVEEKPMVDFKGKKFKPEPAVMGSVQVVKVDDEFSYAHIKDSQRPVRIEDKLRESIHQIINDEQKVW